MPYREHIIITLQGGIAALSIALDISSTFAATDINLVRNSGFEDGVGGSGYVVLDAPFWASSGPATIVRWDTGGGFPIYSDSGPPIPIRGDNFAAGGPGNAVSSLVQIIDLTQDAPTIDVGAMTFRLTAWLGGYANQDDHATLTYEFLSSASTTISSGTMLGPYASNRQNLTALHYVVNEAPVPPQSRMTRLTLTFVRAAGDFNDGYADNIEFVLRTVPGWCAGDFNGDGVVNTADLVRFLGKFGLSVPLGTAEDMNGDGVVNTADLTRFLGRFGTAC